MRIHGVLAAFAIMAATAFSATAQTGAPEATACNPQFARILVEQQVAESKAVVDPVKRIKILIRSADFLWTPENATARAYFSEAWKMAVDRFAEKGHERTELGRGIVAQVPDQRMEVLRAVSKRDSAWAKKLSEQMLADYEKTAKDRKSAFDQEREMYELLYLGREVLKTDPELSRFLIRRVMDYPLSQWWFGIFFSLSVDDRGFADAMYLEALARYRGESPRRMLYLSGYPFGYSNPIGIEKYSVSGYAQEGFTPSPDLQRQFIRTFIARVAVCGERGRYQPRARETLHGRARVHGRRDK